MDEATLRHILSLQVREIKDEELRGIVETVLSKLPQAFWLRESSKVYHPVDERGLNGNLRHTLKVTKLAVRLGETTPHSQKELDLLRASAILHDCLRHGATGTSKWSTKDHPFLVRKFIEACSVQSDWVAPLCTLIEAHMGVWGSPPVAPLANLSTILHFADYIAAQPDVEVKL